MTLGKLFHPVLSVALLSLVATVAVCAEASARDYRSPLDNFVAPIPSGLGMRTNQQHDNEGGRVSFHDDFGDLSAISYWRQPANILEAFADPGFRDFFYSGYMERHVVPNMFRPGSPNARVLHAEFLGEPGAGREYFAIVDLPEGSPLMNARTGRRLDSIRALLMFETGGFLYLLEREIGGGVLALAEQREVSLDDAALQNARDAVHRFRETIAFR